MKLFALFAALMFSSVSFAEGTKVLKGYVNLDRRGAPNFVAVEVSTLEVLTNYPIYTFFSQADVNKMMKCMDKKTTHAITVDQVPHEEEVPTGIPGRTTTSHFPLLQNVKCVKAPGFLEIWRAIVSRSRLG